MPRPLFAVAFVLVTVIVGSVGSARAAGAKKPEFPCAGCITAFPDPSAVDGGLAPLLVVLHGDGDGPAGLLSVWEKQATARGVIVFAPKCPVADGCKAASWWQWAGDVAWFTPKIDAIDAAMAIDRSRIWIAGWSGGASYLGWVAPSLEGTFAAVSIDGGGMPPERDRCPSKCELPTYFLVGDANPLHDLAKRLRDWFDDCKQGEVTWDLLPGANHGGEWAALASPKKVGTLLDWFFAHPLKCAPLPMDVAPIASMSVDAFQSASSAKAASIQAPSSNESTIVDEHSPPPAPRCACELAGRSADGRELGLVALGLALIRRVVGARSKGTDPRRACRARPSDR